MKADENTIPHAYHFSAYQPASSHAMDIWPPLWSSLGLLKPQNWSAWFRSFISLGYHHVEPNHAKSIRWWFPIWCVSIYLSIYLSIYPSIHLSIYPSIRLSIYPSIHPSIDRSIYLSIYPYLPIYLSTYLPTYLSI